MDNEKVDAQTEISALMSYSLLRSRTFWTLVLMFIVNGWAAISGQLSGPYIPVIDFVLTSVASYFHLKTGQSVSGAN